MVEQLKFYELISVLARQHGLLSLDPSSRLILDSVIERENAKIKTTAADLIKETELSRAVVYRKLADLKTIGWIKDEWVDFKLCYAAGPQCERLFEALSGTLKTNSDQPS